MASRESQGLQAALIVFVLITIALAVTTYVYFRSSEEQAARAATAEENARKAEAGMRQAIDDRNQLKEMLGFNIDTEMAAIKTQFDQDMLLFAADYPETDPKNYRTLPEYLLKAAVDRHATTVAAEDREKAALAEKTATEERLNQEMAKVEESFTSLTNDYNSERQSFVQERARINGEKQQLANTLQTKDREITTVKAAAAQQAEQYTQQISEMQKTLESFITQKRESEQANFETAAGSIIFVNQAERTVWIDLGLTDGLQRHTTFSVYDKNVHQFSPEQVKGEIEVTKLNGRHQAEARIVGDQASNPIIPGDLIYTPAWRPGVFMHFAIAGFIDVNGDGIEDKELLRNIIHANGGVIDQEVDASGNVVGQMTVDTRYLILGDRPDEKTGVDDPQVLAAFSTMYEEATRKGVELMPLPRFLALIGYKAGAVTVQIGKRGAATGSERAPPPDGAPANGAPANGAPANGAQPQPRAGAAPPAGAAPAAEDDSDPFRPRTPPRGANGAF